VPLNFTIWSYQSFRLFSLTLLLPQELICGRSRYVGCKLFTWCMTFSGECTMENCVFAGLGWAAPANAVKPLASTPHLSPSDIHPERADMMWSNSITYDPKGRPEAMLPAFSISPSFLHLVYTRTGQADKTSTHMFASQSANWHAYSSTDRNRYCLRCYL